MHNNTAGIYAMVSSINPTRTRTSCTPSAFAFQTKLNSPVLRALLHTLTGRYGDSIGVQESLTSLADTDAKGGVGVGKIDLAHKRQELLQSGEDVA